MKKNLIKFMILISFMISGCSVDLKTKDIAKSELKNHSMALVDNFFNLTFVENNASAFGLLQQIDIKYRLPIILFLQGSIILLCLLVLWKMRNKKIRLLIAITMVITGAFGNFVDRFLNGYVTDFFHLHYYYHYDFYVFNVADLLINIGVVLLIIQWKDFKLIFDNLLNRKAILKPE